MSPLPLAQSHPPRVLGRAQRLYEVEIVGLCRWVALGELGARLGFTNENLISFGINPRKAGRRRKGPAAGAKKDAAQGTPAAATTTAA